MLVGTLYVLRTRSNTYTQWKVMSVKTNLSKTKVVSFTGECIDPFYIGKEKVHTMELAKMSSFKGKGYKWQITNGLDHEIDIGNPKIGYKVTNGVFVNIPWKEETTIQLQHQYAQGNVVVKPQVGLLLELGGRGCGGILSKVTSLGQTHKDSLDVITEFYAEYYARDGQSFVLPNSHHFKLGNGKWYSVEYPNDPIYWGRQCWSNDPR